MPATFPFDPINSRLRVSTTLAGTYTSVGRVRSASLNEGRENQTKIKYLGGQIVRPGDNTLAGSITVVFDSTDTTGQEILKTAKRNSSTVFLQFCPAGTTAGEKAEQFEANITSHNFDLNADNEAIERTFDFEGVDDAPTTITLA
jgi:hypothetical protein